ncbi:MAG: hypothetical protein M5R42_01970 [Rhodocyclaceae bacterium]|nr:hypothetical protein [Rhodocyclaceae bacterium]
MLREDVVAARAEGRSADVCRDADQAIELLTGAAGRRFRRAAWCRRGRSTTWWRRNWRSRQPCATHAAAGRKRMEESRGIAQASRSG